MSGAATWPEPAPGVAPQPHAARWRTAFGALLAKELRDLAWLAGAIVVAAALLTFGAAAWFDFVLVSLAPAASPTWFGLAALASLPLAAEALCVDSRSGLTRRAQSWPTPRGAMLAAKAAALAVFAVLVLGSLVAAALSSPGPRTMVAHDTLGTLIPRVAAVALFVTLLTAAVTQHSLAALLMGLVSTVVLVVAQGGLFPPLGLAAARLELAVLQLLQRPAQSVALVVGALSVGWVHAARGPAARSVLRRAARAALCVGGLGVVHAGFGSFPWLAAPVAFDDPAARVSQLLPSPEGRRLVIELEHASPHALSWWVMDPLSEAPPQRLSTDGVAAATGLGTSWQVSFLGWSQDGTKIVGASLHPRGRGENWTLDPDTLAVSSLDVATTEALLGGQLQRERALLPMHGGPQHGEAPSKLPVGATEPIDLDGEHWLLCDTDLGTLTLLAADGQPLRTLRAPLEGSSR